MRIPHQANKVVAAMVVVEVVVPEALVARVGPEAHTAASPDLP